MEMTIRKGGAEAVQMAILDGMKAAGLARELDAMTAERDALKAQVERMKAVIRAKDGENERLRRQCRAYRFSRSQAYRAHLDAQGQSVMDGPYRRLVIILAALVGMVIAFAIVTAIIWGQRI